MTESCHWLYIYIYIKMNKIESDKTNRNIFFVLIFNYSQLVSMLVYCQKKEVFWEEKVLEFLNKLICHKW